MLWVWLRTRNDAFAAMVVSSGLWKTTKNSLRKLKGQEIQSSHLDVTRNRRGERIGGDHKKFSSVGENDIKDDSIIRLKKRGNEMKKQKADNMFFIHFFGLNAGLIIEGEEDYILKWVVIWKLMLRNKSIQVLVLGTDKGEIRVKRGTYPPNALTYSYSRRHVLPSNLPSNCSVMLPQFLRSHES